MEESTKNTLEMTLRVALLVGSITTIAYIYDHKYGTIAEREYKKECAYKDSCEKFKKDSILRYEKVLK